MIIGTRVIDIKHKIWNKQFCEEQFKRWGDNMIRACEDCPDKDSCEVIKNDNRR